MSCVNIAARAMRHCLSTVARRGHGRRIRVDFADIGMLRREPRSPTVALVGITQATGVLAFDFHSR